jgi:XTP/dITP diphosphohydrolase
VTGRLTLLVGSPRIAAGLFTRTAWQTLEAADAILARDASEPLADAVAESGVPVGHLGEVSPPALARLLMDRAAEGDVVWVSSANGDPGLTDAIASEVSRLGSPPEVEVLVASWDVPGSRLLDLVAVMDRLRSPGGCPWDAEQTPESLVKYLIEESHEAAEAIESGDRDHIREELGDVLLQVVFQARVAQEHATEPFDVDDVAGAIIEKLVRRHPHVFADGDASTPAEVERAWEQIKAAERAAKAPHGGGEDGHQGLLHGIPRSLPSLLAAEKVLARFDRTGGDLATVEAGDDDLGMAIVALAARARERGESAEALVRLALARLDAAAQDGARPASDPPSAG